MKAIVLLSGGLDSATCLAIALDQGYECYPLAFDYHQILKKELDSAKGLCLHYNLPLKILELDLARVTTSALLQGNEPVPQDRERMDEGIPPTYVPARNTIFLSHAMAWSEVLGAGDIFIGVNAIDYSGYPDCRPEYIEAFERMAHLATKAGVEGRTLHIRTPLINLTKAQIIRKGVELGVDYSLTRSCYDPARDGTACGRCDSCHLRKKGFQEAGIPDPAIYKDSSSLSC